MLPNSLNLVGRSETTFYQAGIQSISASVSQLVNQQRNSGSKLLKL